MKTVNGYKNISYGEAGFFRHGVHEASRTDLEEKKRYEEFFRKKHVSKINMESTPLRSVPQR